MLRFLKWWQFVFDECGLFFHNFYITKYNFYRRSDSQLTRWTVALSNEHMYDPCFSLKLLAHILFCKGEVCLGGMLLLSCLTLKIWNTTEEAVDLNSQLA